MLFKCEKCDGLFEDFSVYQNIECPFCENDDTDEMTLARAITLEIEEGIVASALYEKTNLNSVIIEYERMNALKCYECGKLINNNEEIYESFGNIYCENCAICSKKFVDNSIDKTDDEYWRNKCYNRLLDEYVNWCEEQAEDGNYT